MNFYLAAVDDLIRHPDDKPGIGLILCKTRNGIIAEYALRNMAAPMGISEFRHLEKLPDQLKGTLPAIEEIEAELGTRHRLTWRILTPDTLEKLTLTGKCTGV